MLERKKHLCRNAKSMKKKDEKNEEKNAVQLNTDVDTSPLGNDEAIGIPSLGGEMTSFSKHDVIWRTEYWLHRDANGQG